MKKKPSYQKKEAESPHRSFVTAWDFLQAFQHFTHLSTNKCCEWEWIRTRMLANNIIGVFVCVQSQTHRKNRLQATTFSVSQTSPQV